MCLAIHSPRVATPSRLTKGKLGEGVPFFGLVETQTMQTDVYLQGSWVGNEKVTGPCLPADVKAVSRAACF